MRHRGHTEAFVSWTTFSEQLWGGLRVGWNEPAVPGEVGLELQLKNSLGYHPRPYLLISLDGWFGLGNKRLDISEAQQAR